MRSIHMHTSVALVVAAVLVVGCGSDGRTTPSTQVASSETATTQSATTAPATKGPATTAPATTATPQPATGEQAKAEGGSRRAYASTVFTAPFDIDVPPWLAVTPDIEHPNFVTWLATDTDEAVRFLIPVDVFRPGDTVATPLPHDFVSYLLGQADHGAHFGDVTEAVVGGEPATILTATVDAGLDGSLGCPADGMLAEDCFGLQPEYVLRIAVIDHAGETLLVWLRHDAASDPATGSTGSAAARFELFEQMLQTIRFSDRVVATPTSVAGDGSLDGTYEWTLTKDDALSHGTAGDRTAENLALLPATFTITMVDGSWQLSSRDGGGSYPDQGHGEYSVDDGRLRFEWGGNVLTFAFTLDSDGRLHLDPQGQMNDGDRYVWATEAWVKLPEPG